MPTDPRFDLHTAELLVGTDPADMTTLGRREGLAVIATSFPRAVRTRLDADGIERTIGQGPRGGTLTFTVDSTDGDNGTDRLFAPFCCPSAHGFPGQTLHFELRLQGTGSGLPATASSGPARASLTVPAGIATWAVAVNVAAPIDRTPQT